MITENYTACLTQYVKILNIPITKRSINEELEKHPDRTSFLGFSDVLSNWGVPNSAFRVESKNLEKIPAPFIVHLSYGRGEFAIVTKIIKDQIWISNEKRKNQLLSLEDFDKIYTGNIFLADPSSSEGEQNYPQKKRKELVKEFQFPIVLSACILLAIIHLIQSSFFYHVTWQIAALTFVKSSGLFVSILLLIQSIDANSLWIKKICTVGKRSDCNTILSSKAAKVTKELSWSEVGFFYFGGTWLFLLFNFTSIEAIQALAVLNLLSLPFILYSFYFQIYVAKKWCLLCCLIQGALWLEFVFIFNFVGQTSSLMNSGILYGLIASLMIPILLWILIKPFLQRVQEFEPLKQQLKVFKYNSGMFQKALSEQPTFVLPEESHCIVLGNKEAKQIVTIVSDLYCSPCSKTHRVLNEWLSQRNDLQFRIVFATSEDTLETKGKAARHLIALNKSNNKLIRQALHDWYGQERKDYGNWAIKYPVEMEVENDLSLKKQKEWCRMVDVVSTPTIFINGKKLPDPYQFEDIKYFL